MTTIIHLLEDDTDPRIKLDMLLRDLEEAASSIFILSDPATIEQLMPDCSRIFGAALALNLVCSRLKQAAGAPERAELVA